MENINPNSSENLPAQNEALNNILNNVVGFLNNFNWEQNNKYKKSKLYPYAFQINENYVLKLEERVEDCLKSLGAYDYTKFNCQVRFQDLTTVHYQDLKEVLKRAGDKADPESITFNWRAFMSTPISSFAAVQMNFLTEKPLNNEESGIMDYHTANMQLAITGDNDKWVNNTFSELDPFMLSAKLGGIYKPLLWFRNKTIVEMSSYALGMLSYGTYLEYGSRVRSHNHAPETDSIRKGILSQPDLEHKFDAFIKQVYKSDNNSPILANVVYFAAGLVVLMAAMYFFKWLLPKLIPKSGINIGLSKNRFEEYENAFKLVIFSVILSGFLIPIIRTLIGFLVSI